MKVLVVCCEIKDTGPNSSVGPHKYSKQGGLGSQGTVGNDSQMTTPPKTLTDIDGMSKNSNSHISQNIWNA